MRYLFCSSASIGLLGPSITIAQEMQKRGHEVAFVTGQTMDRFLAKTNLKRIPSCPRIKEGFDVKSTWRDLDAIRQVEHIEYACEQFDPDVLVGQTLTWGAMAVHKQRHLPLAIIGQAGYIWPTDPPLPYYNLYNPAFYNRVMERYRLALNIYKKCCDFLKIAYEQTSYAETPLLGNLSFVQSTPILEGDPNLLPQRVHLVGNCSWNPPQIDDTLQHWLDEAKAMDVPIIYVQIGRVLKAQNFVRYIVQILKKRNVRVVASFGGANGAVDTVPENFFVREYIFQGQVLPYASAIICSGTTTNVLGAATYGLPLLIIPANNEEPYDLAFRCLHAQMGSCLDAEEVTLETLQQKMEELVQRTELSSNAKKVQRGFASLKGPSRASELLELLSIKRSSILRKMVDNERS